MDHFSPNGPPNTPGWEDRAVFIRDLIEDGYENQIMLSHDWNVTNMAFGDSYTYESNPNGYLWISHGVLSFLKELGVSED